LKAQAGGSKEERKQEGASYTTRQGKEALDIADGLDKLQLLALISNTPTHPQFYPYLLIPEHYM